MIQAIVFDCYGTLIDTGSGSINAVKQILTMNHCDTDPIEFYNYWKRIHLSLCSSEPFRLESNNFLKSLKETYRVFSINGIPEDDVNIYLATLGKRSIFPEVHEVVAQLSTKFSLVIGSNSDHTPLLNDISRNQININTVYSSEILRSYKPDSNFFRKILSNIQLSTDEIIYVGDSQIEDILAPSRLGIKSIWINRNNNQLHEDIPQPFMECCDLRGVLEVM